MGTQWENFLKNLGEWEGSFDGISPTGEVLKSVPSLLILEGLEENRRARLTLRRSQTDYRSLAALKPDVVQEFESLGRHLIFFDNGAFSKGNTQLGPFSQFGVEGGFVAGDRRLRFVQIFDSNGGLDFLTLIPEKRAGSDATFEPALTLDKLLGTWQGEANTQYPDLRTPDIYPTTLKVKDIGGGLIEQELTFENQTIASTGRVEGSVIHFNSGSLPIRLLLLSNGASMTLPMQLKLRQSFFLEAGWLLEPDLRQRLIRSYDETGAWVSSTLMTERRVN
ncbi:MAG: DUF3598 family protein [Oscillatoria sp. SIO1A7]|nr:DUF3598 family protein [Oscillatoria sp. SIO1A7]